MQISQEIDLLCWTCGTPLTAKQTTDHTVQVQCCPSCRQAAIEDVLAAGVEMHGERLAESISLEVPCPECGRKKPLVVQGDGVVAYWWYCQGCSFDWQSEFRNGRLMRTKRPETLKRVPIDHKDE